MTRRRARLVHERPGRAQQTHVQPAHRRERSERTRVTVPLAHPPGFVEVRPRRTRVTLLRPRDVREGAHRALETLRLDALVVDGERATGRGVILSEGTRLARLRGDSARRRAERPRGARDALRRAVDFRIKPRGTRHALRRARDGGIIPLGTRGALVRSPRAVAHAARAHGTRFARRVSLPLGVRARLARLASRRPRGGRTRPRGTQRARARTRGVAETSAGTRQTVRRGSASFAGEVGGGGAQRARRRRRRRLVRSRRARVARRAPLRRAERPGGTRDALFRADGAAEPEEGAHGTEVTRRRALLARVRSGRARVAPRRSRDGRGGSARTRRAFQRAESVRKLSRRAQITLARGGDEVRSGATRAANGEGEPRAGGDLGDLRDAANQLRRREKRHPTRRVARLANHPSPETLVVARRVDTLGKGPRRRRRGLHARDERLERVVRVRRTAGGVRLVAKSLENQIKRPLGVVLRVHAQKRAASTRGRRRVRRVRRRRQGFGRWRRRCGRRGRRGRRRRGRRRDGGHASSPSPKRSRRLGGVGASRRRRIQTQLAVFVRTPRVHLAHVVHRDGVPGARGDGGDVDASKRLHHLWRESRDAIAVAELTVQTASPREHAPVAAHARHVVPRGAHLHDVHPLQAGDGRRHGGSVRVRRVGVFPDAVAELTDVAPSEGVHAPARKRGDGGERVAAHLRGGGGERLGRGLVERAPLERLRGGRLGRSRRGRRGDGDGEIPRRRDGSKPNGLEVCVAPSRALARLRAIRTPSKR